MKRINKLSLAVLLFSASIGNVWSQSESQESGFFAEGARLTVTQVTTLRDDGVIVADYSERCANCETRLTYNDNTQIFAGINAVKLRSREISSLRGAAASIFVDGDDYIYKIRLFETP